MDVYQQKQEELLKEYNSLEARKSELYDAITENAKRYLVEVLDLEVGDWAKDTRAAPGTRAARAFRITGFRSLLKPLSEISVFLSEELYDTGIEIPAKYLKRIQDPACSWPPPPVTAPAGSTLYVGYRGGPAQRGEVVEAEGLYDKDGNPALLLRCTFSGHNGHACTEYRALIDVEQWRYVSV